MPAYHWTECPQWFILQFTCESSPVRIESVQWKVPYYLTIHTQILLAKTVIQGHNNRMISILKHESFQWYTMQISGKFPNYSLHVIIYTIDTHCNGGMGRWMRGLSLCIFQPGVGSICAWYIAASCHSCHHRGLWWGPLWWGRGTCGDLGAGGWGWRGLGGISGRFWELKWHRYRCWTWIWLIRHVQWILFLNKVFVLKDLSGYTLHKWTDISYYKTLNSGNKAEQNYIVGNK